MSTRLTLFVPGLCAAWRGEGADVPAAQTPILRRLLARADRVNTPAQTSSLASFPASFEDGLARLFGVSAQALPWGALGCWGESGACPQGFVLRLDPVHFKLGMTDAIVFGGTSLHLSMDEANTLARALEQHFGECGWRIEVAAPQRWYLHLPESSDLVTVPLAQALGRDAGLFKPQGKDAPRWLADMTEAQMVLFAHPLNQAREARGLPVINSVWPWGAGDLAGSERFTEFLSANELTRNWRKPAPTGQGVAGDTPMDFLPSPLTGEGLGERVEAFATERSTQTLQPPLPSPPPPGGRELFPSNFASVYTNHPLARGLAYAQGLPVHDLAETLAETLANCADLPGNTREHALIVLD
ncbi:MAG TPA: hypothetical protein ENO09_09940, partial [bacterium]|nr:hypothetical protein [bacterium]